MAQTVQDAKRERIEIVDQPEEINEQKKSWLRIPLAVAAIVTLFLLVRRFTSKKEY
jgi:hypothetical protein